MKLPTKEKLTCYYSLYHHAMKVKIDLLFFTRYLLLHVTGPPGALLFDRDQRSMERITLTAVLFD